MTSKKALRSVADMKQIDHQMSSTYSSMSFLCLKITGGIAVSLLRFRYLQATRESARAESLSLKEYVAFAIVAGMRCHVNKRFVQLGEVREVRFEALDGVQIEVSVAFANK